MRTSWVRPGTNEWHGGVDRRKRRSVAPFASSRGVENSRRLAPRVPLVDGRRTPVAARWIEMAWRKKKSKSGKPFLRVKLRLKESAALSLRPVSPLVCHAALRSVPAARFGMRSCSVKGSIFFFRRPSHAGRVCAAAPRWRWSRHAARRLQISTMFIHLRWERSSGSTRSFLHASASAYHSRLGSK